MKNICKMGLVSLSMITSSYSTLAHAKSLRLFCGGDLGDLEYSDGGKDVTTINPKGETFYNRIKSVSYMGGKIFIKARGGDGEYEMRIVFDSNRTRAVVTAWQDGHKVGHSINCDR